LSVAEKTFYAVHECVKIFNVWKHLKQISKKHLDDFTTVQACFNKVYKNEEFVKSNDKEVLKKKNPFQLFLIIFKI